MRAQPGSDEADGGGFGALVAFGDVDDDTLAFVEPVEAGALQRRGVHKHILAAAIADDKAKALDRIVPLDRAGFLDGGTDRAASHRDRRRRPTGYHGVADTQPDADTDHQERGVGYTQCDRRLVVSRNRNLDMDLVLAGPLGWEYEETVAAAGNGAGNRGRVVLPGAGVNA